MSTFVKIITKTIKNSKALTFLAKNSLYYLAKLLLATYRVDATFEAGTESAFFEKRGVICLWHQQIIAGFFFFYKFGGGQSCIVSSSKDGKIAGYILNKLGFKVIYGSAFKNPISMIKKALSVLRNDGQLCIIGDGSRGPAFELKPGVQFLATTVDVPLFFIECSSTWKICFKKSWDKFELPLPFSKIKIKVCKITSG